MWFISRSRRDDVRGVLSECCDLQTPVTVQLYEGRVLAQGRFESFKNGELRLIVYGLPAEAIEMAGSLACVSFHYKKRSAVFLTGVRRQVQGDRMRLRIDRNGFGTHTLMLDKPAVISYAEARRSVRFKVLDPNWVSAEVQLGDEVHYARVVDLGLTGVALNFAPYAAPPLTPGSIVTITLKQDNAEVKLEARMVRRRESTQAFAFVGLQHESPTEELEGLRKICLALEELGANHRAASHQKTKERTQRRRRRRRHG